jgi:hypothetical protein
VNEFAIGAHLDDFELRCIKGYQSKAAERGFQAADGIMRGAGADCNPEQLRAK